MSDTADRSSSSRALPEVASFGSLLRRRRQERRLSQLALSLASGVSQRHLSVLESGGAQPGRALVVKLADSLELPARQRAELLSSAGYALRSQQTGGSASDDGIRKTLAAILEHHEPFPAAVLDGLGNVQAANRAATRLAGRLCSRPVHNLILSVFDPDALRPVIENWPEVAYQHRLRVRREWDLYAGTPEHARAWSEYTRLTQDDPEPIFDSTLVPLPALVVRIRKDDLAVDLYTTAVTFGAAYDPALHETRVECFFPADDRSRATLVELAREDEEVREG